MFADCRPIRLQFFLQQCCLRRVKLSPFEVDFACLRSLTGLFGQPLEPDKILFADLLKLSSRSTASLSFSSALSGARTSINAM